MTTKREQFEVWMSENGRWPKAIQRNGDGYLLAQAQSSWAAWLTAWQAAKSTPSTSEVVLPELPEPNGYWRRSELSGLDPFFCPDKMHAYARQAVEMNRGVDAKRLDWLLSHLGSREIREAGIDCSSSDLMKLRAAIDKAMGDKT